jgi:hypothetical protein
MNSAPNLLAVTAPRDGLPRPSFSSSVVSLVVADCMDFLPRVLPEIKRRYLGQSAAQTLENKGKPYAHGAFEDGLGQGGSSSSGLGADRGWGRKPFEGFSILFAGKEFFPLLMSEVSTNGSLGRFEEVLDC